MSTRPKYRDLPDGSAWDVLDPRLGSLELLTPERVAAAARLVRTGTRFALDLPLDLPSPPFFSREPYRHEVFSLGTDYVFDDKLDNYFPQSSTQWDGFGHFGHPAKGFFGGRAADDIRSNCCPRPPRLCVIRPPVPSRAAGQEQEAPHPVRDRMGRTVPCGACFINPKP